MQAISFEFRIFCCKVQHFHRMQCLRNFIAYLREFCENCSIAGLCYIANKRLHFIERVFWLICVVMSAFGAYYLINLYKNNFEIKAVSIVFETVSDTKVTFPSVSVCNFLKKSISNRIEEYVNSNCEYNCKDYDYERENQLLLFVFPHSYHDGSMKTTCERVESCSTCNKCFGKEDRIYLEEFPFNCTELFAKCSAAGESFDCCHYFRPFITPFGKCFLLNSLQNNHRNSKHWFNKTFHLDEEKMEMTITGHKPMQVSVNNFEDVPNLVEPGTSITLSGVGKRKVFQVYIEEMINDPDVRDISPHHRKCRFWDEVLPTSLYKAHSFSACLNDCVRMHQLRLCNCSIQTLVPKANEKYPPCDLNGLYCLEHYSLIKPDAKNLLPWSKSGLTCKCLPSCTEYLLESVYESQSIALSKEHYEVMISIPHQATFTFRRQALRTYLDVIVTIGGILGLYLGASILSGVEILHFLVLWVGSILKI